MAKQAEVVLLDRSHYPRAKVCGSGLSPHALSILSRLQLLAPLAKEHAKIRAVTATAPGGARFRVATGRDAWVIPRAELDHRIARTAVAFGATFKEQVNALKLLRDPKGQVRGIKTDAGELEADIVVCADGSPSRFSGDTSPKTTIRTVMGRWRGASFPAQECSMVWDARLAGYYAWVFPEPHGIFNIGLTIPEHAPDATRLRALFEELLDEHFADGLRGAEQVGAWREHPAVISTRVGTIIEPRAMWVGESARLVSPGTIEGISFALESGLTAATHIGSYFGLHRGFSPLARRGYEALTAARTLPKFWAAEAFVRAMSSPSARRLGAELIDSPLAPLLQAGIKHLLGDAEDIA